MPVGDQHRDTGHGRRETRTIKALTLQTPGRHWVPHAQQAVHISRTRTIAGKRTRETVYLVTSLPAAYAQPAGLQEWARLEWHIENRLHYIRDVTFPEDAHRARTGNGPPSQRSYATPPSDPLRQRRDQHRPNHPTRQPPPPRPHHHRDQQLPNYAMTLAGSVALTVFPA